MKRGTIVKTWFDTGAMGATILFGVVTACGPKTFTVTWESGIRNRVRHGQRCVEVCDGAALETGREVLQQRGLIPKNNAATVRGQREETHHG